MTLSPFMKQSKSVRSITSSESDNDLERSNSPNSINYIHSPLDNNRTNNLYK